MLMKGKKMLNSQSMEYFLAGVMKCINNYAGMDESYVNSYLVICDKLNSLSSSPQKMIRSLWRDMHIAEKGNKANSVVGTIRRSFEYLDKNTFKKLHCLGKTPLGICQCCMESIQKEGYNYVYLREC